jgi:membrane-bound lytic murein transglycosylase B
MNGIRGWLKWGGGAIAWLAIAMISTPAVAADYDRGWGYLVNRLVADGVGRARVERVFRDRRLPPFDGLGFSLEPRESHHMYRDFRTQRSIHRARTCRAEHDRAFRGAERLRAVPASVLAAILFVETQCGAFTGKHVVLHRLARLAMANEPDNLRNNIVRHTRGAGPAQAERIEAKVRMRAREIEAIFYPEVLATFRLAASLGIDPLSIRGSGSGAFGLPQFLPSSYLRFAVDGNENGLISLYEPADAIASAANYLSSHGWKPGINRAEQRGVIWNYNRSDAYIDTVLYLAQRVEDAYPSTLSLAER